ncbi:hypothetical protein [Mycoplasmoides alvi]|uniref:hypothetical protein n=1 Tax=Mycoplasmoides alvi TaxID=78580 RepID=UPI000A722FBA|nr:hypothetical protein [Mycoplasmoides alvi]
MSYYSSEKFIVTNHARIRIKERLKVSGDSDLVIDMIINEKLNGIVPTYFDDKYDYYKIPGTKNMYALVKKNTKLIITVKPLISSYFF